MAQQRYTDTDRHIATLIRLHRQRRGISQQSLARELGLSFQQVQKYESGANRVSAGRLYAIACFLAVPIDRFFDGLPHPETGVSRSPPVPGAEFATTAEGFELLSIFFQIADKQKRRQLLSFVQAFSDHDAS